MLRTGKWWAVLALVITVALVAGIPGLTPSVTAQEKPKVAFVYVAPVGDMGWTYAHDEGRKMLEAELGVETSLLRTCPKVPRPSA